MGKACSRNQKTLTAMMQGRALVNQLKIRLQLSNSSEKYESLVEKIESSCDNAITLLNSMALLENGTPSHIIGDNSSKSEGSDLDYKDQTLKGVSKKRKRTQKWSEVVRVCSGAGFESHLTDGYSWRKYGQKVILNTNHPRAYYRCTHLNSQRCLAKKHVQRTDDDPSIFEVVYKGKHSCVQETMKQDKEKEGVKDIQQMVVSNSPGPGAGLKVETIELNVTEDSLGNFPSFSFHSTPVQSEHSEVTNTFLDLSKDTDFIGIFSTPFVSPATSESYFSLSQGQVNGFGISSNLSFESDFAEIGFNATASTFGDLDSMLDRVDFDTKFLDAFDNFC